MDKKIGICGIGVVGSAVCKSLEKKCSTNSIKKYDKYKNGGIGTINDLFETNIIFLCLPTLYSEEKKEYNKTSLYEVCQQLSDEKYQGLVVAKSTIEPGTCRLLKEKYNLNILHNPEFLTARTAEEDFENQKHIVIGGESLEDENIIILENFYKKYWKDAMISTSIYEESEIMKISVNCFYSVKIQFFNELYCLTNSYQADYKKVTSMMLKNDWISPNHIDVPGPDGKMSYGGMCFPKDTNALYQLMARQGTPNKVLGATIKERNEMREI